MSLFLTNDILSQYFSRTVKCSQTILNYLAKHLEEVIEHRLP